MNLTRPIIQKYGNVKNKHLTDLALGQDCQFQLAGICNHDSTTTVSCHADEGAKGKGLGLKASDEWIAWGCSECHAALPNMSQEDREGVWQEAFERTYHEMWRQGLIKVAR